MTPVEVIRGEGPILLAQPHGGTYVPADIHARLNDTGRALADTDWHIDRVYDGLLPGATVVRATFHRYVIDANRDPSGVSLYPGQNTTGLCPETDFDGRDIYLPGQTPGAQDIADRLARFHAPYHAALEAELARIRARHGVAILYDCHSIRSVIPFLFDGQLPDFNIGTNGSVTCAPEIEALVDKTCRAATGFSTVLNGRFKGGWTTRHYGRPVDNLHAIQMELAQRTYMAEVAPWAWDQACADRLRPVLSRILDGMNELVLKGDMS